MRLLADQNVYEVTVRFLLDLGHDVVRARDLGLSTASDEKILRRATREGRVLITRDRDFGRLVFLEGKVHAGVILLRITPQAVSEVHLHLQKFLDRYGTMPMKNVFVSIGPSGFRIRRSKG